MVHRRSALATLEEMVKQLSGETTARTEIDRVPSFAEIEEIETSLWVRQQLNLIRQLLVQHNADAEMLDVVDYLLEENDRWIDLDIVKRLQVGSPG